MSEQQKFQDLITNLTQENKDIEKFKREYEQQKQTIVIKEREIQKKELEIKSAKNEIDR